jgi:peptidoglycan/xylan/chitin deacetylase (PgdA/CDA1 family)
VILEPNRRRRNRLLRAGVGVIALIIAGSAVAAGWTPPDVSNIAPTASGALGSAQSTSPPVAIATPSAEPTDSPPTIGPSPSPDARGCYPPPLELAPADVVSHGSRTAKHVALTFDDGTNPDNVHRIVGLLWSTKVNATFFPTGRSVQLAPDVWKHVAEAGYPIANHTYSHQSLKGLCYQVQLAELLHDKRVLDGLGLSMLPVMRPPYEEFDLGTRYATTAAGESHVVLWDVDTLDWTGVKTSTIVRRALAGGPGSIVLMHTSPANTLNALRTIISRYRARGFTFVTVGQLLGIPGPVPFPS